MHTKACGFVVALIFAMTSYVTFDIVGKDNSFPTDFFGTTSIISCGLSFALSIAIALLMVITNKRYNLLRNLSVLFATMFIVLQAAIPILSFQLNNGIILCLLIMFSTMILLGNYGNKSASYAVFTIALLIASGSIFIDAYLFFIPIFLLGCLQMRILNYRTAIAFILGFITPIWILFGFGIISIENYVSWQTPSQLSIFLIEGHWLKLMITVGLSIFVCLSMGIFNMLKIYGYNAQTRAINGFISLLSFSTAVLCIADFKHISDYLTLLNCCTAYQIGHLFILNFSRRSYIAIISVIAVYAGIFCWWLWG